jgi:xylulose-5-phosphate/fructose-6-phosphate phosphoketolase
MKSHDGKVLARIGRRVRACDYLVVAQLFLQSDFLLNEPLTPDDIKPRLLGHWGTCHGINVAYANLRAYFSKDEQVNRPITKPTKTTQPINPFAVGAKLVEDKEQDIDTSVVDPNFSFVLGPGHGFPALQANLFIDGDLEKVDPKATRDVEGIKYLCRNFSWPEGFPSHASPFTPGVICEGGELGYALGAAYGYVLGHPERTVAVMLGDGELETATALSSLNLVKLVGNHRAHGQVIPILHLNGYKISAPTLYARKSERELHELIRGFGYTPIAIKGDSPEVFQAALEQSAKYEHPFLVLRTEKGATGPKEVDGHKVAGNFLAHQIPLPEAKTNPAELKTLQSWLESYHFAELFNPEKGFTL